MSNAFDEIFYPRLTTGRPEVANTVQVDRAEYAGLLRDRERLVEAERLWRLATDGHSLVEHIDGLFDARRRAGDRACDLVESELFAGQGGRRGRGRGTPRPGDVD